MISNNFRQRVAMMLNYVKPWAITIILFLILRYTGLISGIGTVTNQALMATGFLDAEVNTAPISSTDFNYNFTLKDLDGKAVNFDSYKGKVVFLNMWATWCGPCRAEMASIQQLYSKINNRDIAFVMLSIDRAGSEMKVKEYIQNKQFTFPVFMPSTDFPDQLKVPSIPTTFVVDKDGKIVSKQVGSANFDTKDFKNFLEGLAIK